MDTHTHTHTHTVDTDGITVEALSKLKPAFSHQSSNQHSVIKDGSGTVTAGNALGINDGEAAVVLVLGEELKTLSCSPPIVKVVSWGQAGVDPAVMGIPAVRKVKVSGESDTE